MSYDISLYIDDALGDRHSVHDSNHTSNTWRMWMNAGCDLASFHGKQAYELEAELSGAVHDMRLRPTHYAQWNPDNGWGSYSTTLAWLGKVLEACRRWPNATVYVSH